MKSAKKHLILPCTLCAVGIASLMGCYSNQQDGFVVDENPYAQTAESNEYYQTEVAVDENPYVQTAEPIGHPCFSKNRQGKPCTQVKDGMIVSYGQQNAQETSTAPVTMTEPMAEEQISLDAIPVVVPKPLHADVPAPARTTTIPVVVAAPAEAPCSCAPVAKVQNVKVETVVQVETPCSCPKTKEAVVSEKKITKAKNNTLINIETPVRCDLSLRDSAIVSSVPLHHNAFKLVTIEKTDALPRYEVNDYSFQDTALDLAIQNLVAEAGIRVYSDDALFPEISGDHIRGELSAVIEELAAAGDVFYRYDAAKKRLYLSRWARFVMQVPGGRVGMYTILDALRGANIPDLQPDFGANEIYMRLNTENKKIVNELVSAIEQSSDLVLFDVQVYRIEKSAANTDLDWQKVVQDYGVKRINSSTNGILGRLLSTTKQPSLQTFKDILERCGSVDLISEGVAIMPNNWKVRFDIGQCSKRQMPEKDLSMLLQSNILPSGRVESNIALDGMSGEITSFHTIYNIDDELSIVGVPGSVFNAPENVEYFITLKPRIVKLVK